ncbi:MAG: flagellar hook capping FlgD N-terminal domain-containing protein [Pseudomonadota bacterium]
MENSITSQPILPSGSLIAATADGDTATDPIASRELANSDFETFLTLLTAQLRNQDPLQPIDSAEFVAQLASFSTVEQLIGANERLDGLNAATAAGDLAVLASWIGRSVSATDGRFIADGAEVTFNVPEIAGAETVVAEAVLIDGTVIDSFDVQAGSEIAWDSARAAGQTTQLRLVYTAGGDVIAEQSVPVYREVVALRGAEGGAVLERADGPSLAPGEVSELRTTPDPDA